MYISFSLYELCKRFLSCELLLFQYCQISPPYPVDIGIVTNDDKLDPVLIEGSLSLRYSEYSVACICYLSLCCILRPSHTNHPTLIVLEKESLYLVPVTTRNQSYFKISAATVRPHTQDIVSVMISVQQKRSTCSLGLNCFAIWLDLPSDHSVNNTFSVEYARKIWISIACKSWLHDDDTRFILAMEWVPSLCQHCVQIGGKAAGAVISHQSLLSMAKFKHEWNLTSPSSTALKFCKQNLTRYAMFHTYFFPYGWTPFRSQFLSAVKRKFSVSLQSNTNSVSRIANIT
jgi:hypothetical protein